MSIPKEVQKKRVSNLLNNWPLGTPLMGSDFEMMMDLLMNHENSSQKIGVGVKSIIIKEHPTFHNRGFYIIRVDGSTTDFSYRKCINKPTKISKATSAFRVAIKDQIISFRDKIFVNGNEIICPLTGVVITKNTCHIDHIPPQTFKKLLEEFIIINSIDICKIEIGGIAVDNSLGYYLVDNELSRKWNIFHFKNAKLRAVSKEARH